MRQAANPKLIVGPPPGGVHVPPLHLPVLRGDVIRRGRILDLLERGRASKLVLVHAPAGYGKTTQMIQWLKHLEGAGEGVAWITVDAQDNAAAHFRQRVCMALAGGRCREAMDILASINACASDHARFTLFLDDIDALGDPEAIRVLELLVDYTPPNLHIVMGSREVPALPLGRLRARGDLLEIDFEVLRFLRAEAAQLLYVRGGTDLARPDLDRLVERTEGWAAALHLVALSFARGADRDAVLGQLTGSRLEVVEYLEADVIGKLAEVTRRFLLETSVLRRLSPELCEAVTGLSDCAAILQRLDTAGMFLLPLDDSRRWYRYHALFAEFLRDQLRRTSPDAPSRIARKAADWCATNGFPVDAIEYSLQAGDTDQALALIDGYVGEHAAIGRFPTIRRWLSAMPAEALERHPRLLLANAWSQAFLLGSVEAERVLEQVRRLARTPGSPASVARTLLVLEPVLQIHAGKVAEATASSEAAWEEFGDSAVTERGTLANILAYAYIGAGRHEDAARRMRDAAACFPDPRRHQIGLAYACRNNGVAEAVVGNLRGAIQRFEQVGTYTGADEGDTALEIDPGFVRSLASGYCAAIHYERNRLDEAESWIELHRRYRESTTVVDALILAYLVETRIHRARDDIVRAEEVLLAATRHGGQVGHPRLVTAIEWERVRLMLIEGDVERARILASSIEDAEAPVMAPAYVLPHEEVEGAGIERLRLQIGIGRLQEALQGIEVQVAHARKYLRRRRLAKLLVLQALAMEADGQPQAALGSLIEALRMARTMGAIRTFADEGPACGRLLQALVNDRAIVADRGLGGHLARVIEACLPASASVEAGAEPLAAAPSDRLSTREIQILQRLSQGYSNLAVAQQLFVSPNTVKWHLRQIYEKLHVGNRSQAVFIARQQGLVA